MATPTKSAPAKRKGRRPRTRVHRTIGREEMLVDGSDLAFRQFVHDALAFSVRLLAIRDGFAKLLGISGPQYTILISIAHLIQKGPVKVSDIAEHLHLSGSFVTNESNKLEQLGLLEKNQDEIDRRRVNLEITDLGWDRLDELSEVQSRVNDEHFRSITKKQFAELRKVMPEMVESTDSAISLLNHITGGK